MNKTPHLAGKTNMFFCFSDAPKVYMMGSTATRHCQQRRYGQDLVPGRAKGEADAQGRLQQL